MGAPAGDRAARGRHRRRRPSLERPDRRALHPPGRLPLRVHPRLRDDRRCGSRSTRSSGSIIYGVLVAKLIAVHDHGVSRAGSLPVAGGTLFGCAGGPVVDLQPLVLHERAIRFLRPRGRRRPGRRGRRRRRRHRERVRPARHARRPLRARTASPSAASGRNAGLVMGPHPARARAHRPPQRRALAGAAPLRPAARFRLDRMPLGYLVVAEDARGARRRAGGARRGAARRRRRCASSSRSWPRDLAGGVLVAPTRAASIPAGAVGALADGGAPLRRRDPHGLRGQGADPAPRRRGGHGRGHRRWRDRRGHGRRRRRAVVVARLPLARLRRPRARRARLDRDDPPGAVPAAASPSRSTATSGTSCSASCGTTVGDLAAGAPAADPARRARAPGRRRAHAARRVADGRRHGRPRRGRRGAGRRSPRRAVRLRARAGGRRGRRDALLRSAR